MVFSRTARNRAAWLLAASVLGAALRGAAAEAPGHHLWRVDGGAATVYLLGSVHMLRAEDYPLPEPMQAAFADAEVAVFESDLAVLESIGTQSEFLMRALLPDGELLSERIPPELYARVVGFLDRSGLPDGMLDRAKPSMAAITIEVLELARHGLDPRWGVDKHLYGRARAQGKRMVYLETAEFQMELILGLTPAEGEALLESTLDQVDDAERLFGELIVAWKSGDTRALEAHFVEPLRESPALFARMITDRNARWIEPIGELLNGDDDALVVVGAAHLVGEDSVVDLLRRRGYQVTQQ